MILELKSFQDIANYPTPSDITAIVTHGYWAFGDGGDGFYKRIGAPPPHAGYGTSATGGIFELKPRTVSVKQFGAKGDGAPGDYLPCQNALDYIGSTVGYPPLATVTVDFPAGTYHLSQPLRKPSGILIKGAGRKSTKFTGSALSSFIEAAGGAVGGQPNPWLSLGGVEDCGFDGNATNAIKATAATILNETYRNLWNETPMGFDFVQYAQFCVFDDIYTYGFPEQILLLQGNMNRVRRLDKEAGTGASTSDPYILIRNRAGDPATSVLNTIEDCLIEGATSSLKPLIRLEGANNTIIRGNWVEVTNINGNMIEVVNSHGVRFEGPVFGILAANGKISVSSGSSVAIDSLSLVGDDSDVADVILVDDTSSVDIGLLISKNSHPIDVASRYNVRVNKIKTPPGNTSDQTPPQFSAFSHCIDAGHNLLANPNFTLGRTGWVDGFAAFPGGVVFSSEQSVMNPVTGAKMLVVTGATSLNSLVQEFTITEPGLPFTFSCYVKVDTGAGRCQFWVAGCDVGYPTGSGWSPPISGVLAGEGWKLINQTIVPKTAGVLKVGIGFDGTTLARLECAAFRPGTTGRPSDTKDW